MPRRHGPLPTSPAAARYPPLPRRRGRPDDDAHLVLARQARGGEGCRVATTAPHTTTGRRVGAGAGRGDLLAGGGEAGAAAADQPPEEEGEEDEEEEEDEDAYYHAGYLLRGEGGGG